MKEGKMEIQKKNDSYLKDESELFYSNKKLNLENKLFKKKKKNLNKKKSQHFFIILFLFILLIIFVSFQFLFKRKTKSDTKQIQEEKTIQKLSLDSIKILEREEALDSVLPFVNLL